MSLTIRISPKKWKRRFMQGMKGASANKKRSLSTALIGLSTFFITVFSASPEYSLQMLSSGIQYWQLAFITRFSGMYATSGLIGIGLTLLFSLLVGITMTNTAIQLKANRIDLSSLGALPGFLAGGCASCGVGILSLLGFGGVLASMPFAGNSLRLGGVLLLVILITRNGNPDICKI